MKILAHMQRKWTICDALCDLTIVSPHVLAPMHVCGTCSYHTFVCAVHMISLNN